MINFPAAPQHVHSIITEPTPIYKQEVYKSIAVILLFIFSYIVLVVGAILLAYLCVRLGIGILSNVRGTLPFLASAGVILIGLFTLYFILKFVFSNYKIDRSTLVEITETEQPQLFAFIKKITEETQSPFPKKIYLSNEVNASVFYDSSFLSMFLPIKKNLLIGLGLVNSVTLSEFKAILAHEFGHFSQRSMKVGSYVYNANRIIHNLLYDNGGFYKTLNSVAGVHVVLYFCMQIVSGVVKGIQYVLNQLYLFMNKQNMKLSREMEFHADSVAASVAGSRSLVTSLYRLELAENSFSNALSVCNLILEEKKQEKNIYNSHRFIMNDLANQHEIKIEHGLPQLDASTFSDFDTSRVNVTNQWASHPSTQDRETALLKLNVDAEEVHSSAWDVFVDVEDLQSKMTAKLYELGNVPNEERAIGHFVESKFIEQTNYYQLPKKTNGYWDTKLIPTLELNQLVKPTNEVYGSSCNNLGRQLSGMITDISNLEAILKKEIIVSSFDFKGVKYNTQHAQTILDTILNEKIALEKEISTIDQEALSFHFYNAKTSHQQDEFEACYRQVLANQEKQKNYTELHQQVINEFLPLFQGNEVSIEAARDLTTRAQKGELKVKELAEQLLASSEPLLNLHTINRLKAFIESNRIYFNIDTFQDENIQLLFNDLQYVATALEEASMNHKKKLLAF